MLMDAADDQLVQPSAKKLRLAPSTEEAGLSDYISAAVKFDLDDIANFGEQSTVSLGTDPICTLTHLISPVQGGGNKSLFIQ